MCSWAAATGRYSHGSGVVKAELSQMNDAARHGVPLLQAGLRIGVPMLARHVGFAGSPTLNSNEL